MDEENRDKNPSHVYLSSYADRIKQMNDVDVTSEKDIRALFIVAMDDFYGFSDNGGPRWAMFYWKVHKIRFPKVCIIKK